MASHAGTTPMDRRRDAAAAVAELALYLERAPRSVPDVVGTVGMLQVPNGSINVVPGRCRFSLDLRATTDASATRWPMTCWRAAAHRRAARPVACTLEETMRAAAAPSAPAGSSAGKPPCSALGLPVHRLPSGAGHDAMKLHEVMPQAMLFVRGENAGISHNPLESTTARRMQLCVRAFDALCTALGAAMNRAYHEQLDAWIDAHFDEQVRFLQALVRVPTDTPPGNNAPHAERTAELLAGDGLDAEKHPCPAEACRRYGMQSITNLIVRRRFGEGGRPIALNAHGDVVPPGEGWTHDPYGGEIEDGKLYGRAAAVSKSDFATFTFALRALESLARPAAARARSSCTSPTTRSSAASSAPAGC
jgi:acetylornithine deacetylase/succinyl-diaminopimelate desuccinylase-like protein